MDHIHIEREPGAPGRTKAETLRQIGDRLRQVNGDGPCNPPDPVLALDLLIDAHKEALRECEALRAAVVYRPGLPSIGQVRAHEARGGWWQTSMFESHDFVRVRRWWAYEDTIGEHIVAIAGISPVVDTVVWCRPCDADGTPCPWLAPPGDFQGAAAPSAEGT